MTRLTSEEIESFSAELLDRHYHLNRKELAPITRSVTGEVYKELLEKHGSHEEAGRAVRRDRQAIQDQIEERTMRTVDVGRKVAKEKTGETFAQMIQRDQAERGIYDTPSWMSKEERERIRRFRNGSEGRSR